MQLFGMISCFNGSGAVGAVSGATPRPGVRGERAECEQVTSSPHPPPPPTPLQTTQPSKKPESPPLFFSVTFLRSPLFALAGVKHVTLACSGFKTENRLGFCIIQNTRAVVRGDLQRHINHMHTGRQEAANMREKATAADIHSYVNGQCSTSAEPKLEAAEVRGKLGPGPQMRLDSGERPGPAAHSAPLWRGLS